MYSCPLSSPIKLRMLFSASLRGIIYHAESLGVSVAKKVRWVPSVLRDFALTRRLASSSRPTRPPRLRQRSSKRSASLLRQGQRQRRPDWLRRTGPPLRGLPGRDGGDGPLGLVQKCRVCCVIVCSSLYKVAEGIREKSPDGGATAQASRRPTSA